MKVLNSENKKGFTIIEIIVVIAIFLFVVGAALTIFISIVKNQKRILAEQEILNQISYVEEYMSKALRMAKTETPGSSESCIDIDYIYLLTHYDYLAQMYRGVKFLDQTGPNPDNPICQEFFLGRADLNTPSVPDARKVLWEVQNGGTPVALTPPNLPIESVRFTTNGTLNCESMHLDPCGACSDPTAECGIGQSRITMILEVKIGDGQDSTRTIQTTVSQRNLNAQ